MNIPMAEGWLYACTILDLQSRKVAGWLMSERIKTDLVVQALIMVVVGRRRIRVPTESGEFHNPRITSWTLMPSSTPCDGRPQAASALSDWLSH
jgi:transposase InsO family protein